MPVAFTACTNEEFAVMETPEANGNMITLDKNFALGLTKEANAETRAQYVNGLKFHWLPELDGANPIVDKVGMSWIQGTDGMVYTNYLFEHFAWAVDGETPDIDGCTGKWHDMVFLQQSDEIAGENCNYVTDWSEDKTSAKVIPTLNATEPAPDTQSGYFKTENLTIFGGDYIVYTPYDETLVDAGYLKAKSATSFEDVVAVKQADGFTKGLKGLANEMFCVGAIDNLKGGKTANGFTLYPVNGLIQLKIYKDNIIHNWRDINKIAIYSADGIVYEQEIDASKVAEAGDKGVIAECLKPATEETAKTTKMLLATLKNSIDIKEGRWEWEANNNAYYVHIPALPQTIKNAQVVLIDKDGASVRYGVGDIVVGSNATAQKAIKLTASNTLSSENFYVVDMPTFQTAMTKAGIDGANGETDPVTITLLNDIVYDSKYTDGESGKVIVNREMTIEGGTITVPADEKLTLELQNEAVLTMEEDFIVEGKVDCAECGAEVTIQSGTHTTALNFNGNVDVQESARLNITSWSYSTADVNIAKTLTNDGTVDIFANSILDVNKFVNNNIVEMHAKANKANTAVTVGTLTNAEDAEWLVDAYTMLTVDNLTNNGELTIKATGDATAGEDGTVNVEVAAENNGNIYNYGVYNSNGTTKLNAGSTFTDYVGSQYGNKMPTLAKGENGAKYICEVNTSTKTEGDRLGYALGTKMVTTDVRFVEGESELKHEYQLNDYNELRLAEVNFEIDVNTKDFVFKNNNANAQIVLGGNLTVTSAKSVKFNGYDTKVGGNMVVNCGADISNNGNNSATVTVGGKLSLNGGTTLTVKSLKNAVAATELTEKSWTVEGDVTINGGSSLTVEEKAAAEIGGNLTVADGTAEFGYSSYTDVAGSVDIDADGTFNRVLSSETGANANPAQVWCAEYNKNKNATQVNGAAQVTPSAN